MVNLENRSREENIQDKEVGRRVLQDMKEFAREGAPTPAEDWDLVWVTSGPPIDIAEKYNDPQKEIILKSDDVSAKKDAFIKINESKERLETGIKVVKKVAALRLNKKVEDLTVEDIESSGPEIYWNATDWANNNLRERIEQGFLEQYAFPASKVVVSPNLGIEHTGHQFERIEGSIIEGKRKIVIVGDAYHLPRIKRYLNAKDSKIGKENVIFYPAEPRRVPVGKALGEIRKIPKYIRKGVLPPE